METCRRLLGDQDEVEWVSFPSPSPAASKCRSSLSEALYNQEWSWRGNCLGCNQQYGGGLPDGRCENSRPKSVGGVELKSDKEVIDLLGELGCVGMLTYLGDIHWLAETGSDVDKQRQSRVLCPRCRALDYWMRENRTQIDKRAKNVAKKLAEGLTDVDGLLELPASELQNGGAPDYLFSRHLRVLLGELRQYVGKDGVGGPAAVVVRSGLMCYILWQILCMIQPVWLGRPERGANQDYYSRLWRKPTRKLGASARSPCSRYHPGVMKQSELDRVALDVKDLKVDVVVICADLKANEQPRGHFGPCKVVYWDKYVMEPPGLLCMGRQVCLWEDRAGSPDSCTADAEATTPTLEPAVPRLLHLPAASCSLSQSSLQDDVAILERVWLRQAGDSYTQAALREQPGGVILLEQDARGFQARVRSLGQLASLEPELRSDSFSCPDLARGDAAAKAFNYFRKNGLLDDTLQPLPVAPVVAEPPSCLAPSQPVGWPEKVPNGKGRLVRWARVAKSLDAGGGVDSDVEGPWIQTRLMNPQDAESTAPYCLLCDVWVDDGHVTSRRHERARRDVAGMELSSGSEEQTGEPEVLPFEALHDLDLSYPGKEWPLKMRVFRIEVHTLASGPCKDYALLLALPEEEHAYFGLSMEWRRNSEAYGFARFVPYEVDWREMQQAARSEMRDPTVKPEELLRLFHEAVLHQLLPGIRPHAAEARERRPTAALLVRLACSEAQGAIRFAWSEMEEIVQNNHELTLRALLTDSTAFDDDAVAGEAVATDAEEAAAASASVPASAGTAAPAVLDLFAARYDAATPELVPGDEEWGPHWLVSLLHRWYRLHDLELAALKYGPVFPVLSPLALDAALTLPGTRIADLPFGAYRVLGNKVLRLLLAVTAHCRSPGSQHMQLLQHIERLMSRERLAELVAKTPLPHMLTSKELHTRLWKPPGVRSLQHGCSPSMALPVDAEVRAQVAEAFVGVYYASEGSFFSANQFIEWLHEKAAQEPAEGEEEYPWEKAVLGHLLFGSGRPFRGRTPSYSEFYEDSVPSAGDQGEKILRVHYSDSSTTFWAEYRRPRPGSGNTEPLERFPNDPDPAMQAWKPLLHNPQHATFMSSRVHTIRQLPNKVSSWLLGKPVAPLVTVKPYTMKGKSSGSQQESPQTPDYVQLQERCRASGPETELWVNYREHGWHIYSRSDDGNLGMERADRGSRKDPTGLMYSESLKTLKSQSKMLNKPLPNKVTEWIHHCKCLAFIVTPKKSESSVAQHVEEQANTEISDTQEEGPVRWRYHEHQLECTVETVSGGVLLMEVEIRSGARAALIYSEELKTWLSPFLTKRKEEEKGDRQWDSGVPVPSAVLDWLKQRTQKALRDPGHMSDSFRQHYFKAPWCVVPHFVKAMVPRAIDLASVEAQMLQYTFSNSMLLIEALTHASYTKAKCPPNQRLAVIGGPLAELLLTQAVIRERRFPMHRTHIAEDGDEEPSQTFAVSALPDSELSWPRLPEVTGGTGSEAVLTDADRLLEWVNTCCNHITYSYVCCQMNVHKHILYTSPKLEDSIRDFARVARRARASPTSMWQTLSAYDAPRVLSDTLLAVIAAVFLDSDWNTLVKVFEPIFQEHVLACLFHEEMLCNDGGPVPGTDPIAHLARLAADEDLVMAVRPVVPPACTAAPGPRVQEALIASVRQTTLDPGRGRAFEPLALAPAAPPPVADESGQDAAERRRRAARQQCEAAFPLRDFNFYNLWLGGVQVGPPVGAASPRSAARRCARFALGGGGEGQTKEALKAVRTALDCSHSDEEAAAKVRGALLQQGALLEDSSCSMGGPVPPDPGGGGPLRPLVVRAHIHGLASAGGRFDSSGSERGEEAEENGKVVTPGAPEEGAVWCSDCEMWLNGPTQWEDHKIGKKHRKNTQKKTGQNSGTRIEGKVTDEVKTRGKLSSTGKHGKASIASKVIEPVGNDAHIGTKPEAPVAKAQRKVEHDEEHAPPGDCLDGPDAYASGASSEEGQMEPISGERKHAMEGYPPWSGGRAGPRGDGHGMQQQWAAYMVFPAGYSPVWDQSSHMYLQQFSSDWGCGYGSAGAWPPSPHQ